MGWLRCLSSPAEHACTVQLPSHRGFESSKSWLQEEWPLLVVAPASLRLVWAEELARWLPHLRACAVHVIEGRTDRLQGGPVPQVRFPPRFVFFSRCAWACTLLYLHLALFYSVDLCPAEVRIWDQVKGWPPFQASHAATLHSLDIHHLDVAAAGRVL